MSEGGWKARYLGRRPVDGPLNDYKLTSVVTSLQQEQKTRKGKGVTQRGVTKKCRLSLLTNGALVYEPKCGGGGGFRRQLYTWSPYKLWRSNSISNLWGRHISLFDILGFFPDVKKLGRLQLLGIGFGQW
jgi:hypothetical protein